MAKTITVRVNDESYHMIKTAAEGSKRTISNFMEYATISYLSQEAFVEDEEVDDIMKDNNLLRNIRKAEKDIKEGSYRMAESIGFRP